MKVLIWILCFLIVTILNLLIGEITGFQMGKFLLYFVCYVIAQKLCLIWDKRKISKEASLNGLSIIEYIKEKVPIEVIQTIETMRCDHKELKNYLEECRKARIITRAYADILYNEYMLPFDPKSSEIMNGDEKNGGNCIRFCRKCGIKLIEDSEFCSNCGTKIVENMEMKQDEVL